MLQPFGEEIWLSDGPVVAAVAGFRYPTRMAVVRLSGLGLLVWSPVELSPPLRAAVDALGVVRCLIAPNTLHDLFLAQWQAAYPDAALYGPPRLRQQRRDLRFEGDLVDTPPTDWAGELDQVEVGGNLITTEVVFFHRQSRTALFTDLIQNFEPGWFTGWRAVVARLDFMTAPEPQVPRKFRLAFVDRRQARAALRRILDWPVERVVMAHAPPVRADGRAFLKRAFRWLMG